MAEHKRWQHDVLNELLKEALDEMAEALASPTLAKKSDARLLPFPEPEVKRGPRSVHV